MDKDIITVIYGHFDKNGLSRILLDFVYFFFFLLSNEKHTLYECREVDSSKSMSSIYTADPCHTLAT